MGQGRKEGLTAKRASKTGTGPVRPRRGDKIGRRGVRMPGGAGEAMALFV